MRAWTETSDPQNGVVSLRMNPFSFYNYKSLFSLASGKPSRRDGAEVNNGRTLFCLRQGQGEVKNRERTLRICARFGKWSPTMAPITSSFDSRDLPNPPDSLLLFFLRIYCSTGVSSLRESDRKWTRGRREWGPDG